METHQILPSSSNSYLPFSNYVPRSFVQASQKHLFHSITIDNMATSQGLYNLLSSNPVISSYIRSFTIVPHPIRIPPGKTSWIVHDQNLTSILYALMPRIRQLQLGLGNKYNPRAAWFDWALFPLRSNQPCKVKFTGCLTSPPSTSSVCFLS